MSGSFLTSRDLYHRIRWDSKFNPHLVKIWYKDRFKPDLVPMPFSEWIPPESGGEIPWHRVYQISYGDEMLWDRNTKTYDESVIATGEKSLPILKYHSTNKESGWLSMDRWIPEQLPIETTIVSFNLLFDLYDPEITDLKPRLPLISKQLESLESTIICLQEVTPGILNYLMGQAWVRKNYYIMDIGFDKEKAPNVFCKYGQLLLTRVLPTKVDLLAFNQMKKVIIVEWQDCNHTIFQLFNLHLTSSMAPGSKAKRREQFKMMQESFNQEANILLVGDFNCNDDEIPMNELTGFKDTWEELHEIEDEPGYTYDCSRNTLAKTLCDKETVMRLDRMIYLSRDSLRASRIRMIGEEMINGHHLSDHFGLEAQFSFSSEVPTMTTTTSTLFGIVPPLNRWYNIQKIRKRYDENYNKLPPHLTLFSRFFPTENMMGQEDLLKQLRKIPPFQLTFKKTEIFEHEKSFSWVLIPEETSHLKLIRGKLNRLLKLPSSFNPHLTLGKFTSRRALEAAKKSIPPSQYQLEFLVDHFCLLSKEKSPSFNFINRFPLGETVFTADLSQKRLLGLMKSLFDTIAPLQIQVVGSRLFLGDNGSDLDLLVSGKLNEEEFFNQILKKTAMITEFDWCYLAPARVPALMIRIRGGQEVNIVYQKDGVVDLSRSRMLDDPTSLLEYTKPDTELFLELLQWVRNWAKARRVYGFGYPNGLGYAILVAHLWSKNAVSPPRDLMEGIDQFFTLYSNWDWDTPKPISLIPSINFKPTTPSARLLPIILPTAPHESCNRSIFRQTRHIWLQEIKRGTQIFDLDVLMQPRKPSGTRVIMRLESSSLPALGKAHGCIKATLQRLFINLEKHKVAVQPWGWESENPGCLEYSFLIDSKTETLTQQMNLLKKKLKAACPLVLMQYWNENAAQ